MNKDELKKDLDEKIKNHYNSNEALISYFNQTFESFIHRYLETTSTKDVKSEEVSPLNFVAISYESNMGEAFKISQTKIKEGIKNLAKTVPKEKNPRVQYKLQAKFTELTPTHGTIILESSVNWDFPDFASVIEKSQNKIVKFNFYDISDYRKNLALKLEDVCELFL